MLAGQVCLRVAGKHINKIPRKSQENAGTVPGQSCENFVLFTCFLFIVFFPKLGMTDFIKDGFGCNPYHPNPNDDGRV